MKKALKMLNALDKCEAATPQEKEIKQAGMTALHDKTMNAYGPNSYSYQPGRGFIPQKGATTFH